MYKPLALVYGVTLHALSKEEPFCFVYLFKLDAWDWYGGYGFSYCFIGNEWF